MTRNQQKMGEVRLSALSDDALEPAVGGATHELAHVVQQRRTAQYNPKELAITKNRALAEIGSADGRRSAMPSIGATGADTPARAL